MVSSQKIILMMLFINIVISGSLALYGGDATAFYSHFEEQRNSTDAVQWGNRADLQDEGTQGWWVKPSQNIVSFFEDAWDTVQIGWKLIELFMQGINPFAIQGVSGVEGGERVIYTMLNFFRTTFLILVMLEAYMLFKNRKTS